MQLDRRHRLILFLLGLPGSTFSYSAVTVVGDICIYGGTSGGVIAAAEAAAAVGKSTVIVEARQHLGGVSAGGLGFTDFGRKEAVAAHPKFVGEPIALLRAVHSPRSRTERAIRDEALRYARPCRF